jgi:cell division protein FtsI/penicillin-binding protein 2
VGFVGGDNPQYVIAVHVIRPKIPGYAGAQAAQPIFGDVAHMLLDKFNVTPRK